MVKTKSGELQTAGNNIERGERGIKYSLPACKSRHSRKMCDIRLFQLLLSMIVDFSGILKVLKKCKTLPGLKLT